MKNLYPKNKGKVYPSPSSPSSSSLPKLNPDTALNVLSFLPAAILTLIAILSGDEKEVLAYLITSPLRVTNPSCSSPLIEEKKKCKKPQSSHNHKVPTFGCGCFDCYTVYWTRWDSSPNRELIHQVIEAFEENLSTGEKSKKGVNNRGGRKNREKVFDKTPKKNLEKELQNVGVELQEDEKPEIEAVPIVLSDEVVVLGKKEQSLDEDEESEMVEMAGEMMNGNNSNSSSSNHKGLARKVLPDVMGLFNSRIWSLWSTNI